MTAPLQVLCAGQGDAWHAWLVRALQDTNPSLQGEPVAPRDLAARLRERRWDAVIIHHEAEGSGVVRSLGEIRRQAPGIPALVVSSVGGEETVATLMKAGAADFIAWEKPERLVPALVEAAGRHRDPSKLAVTGWALHQILTGPGGDPVDYRFLAVNAAFEELTGLVGSDLVGRTVLEVLPDLEPSWIETYAEVARTGKPVRFERYAAALDRWYLVAAHRPRPEQFVTEFVDITEQKRAELALAQSERRYRQLVDEINDGIFVTDETGQITFANRALAEIHGFDSPKDLVGRRFLDLVAPHRRSEIESRFRRAMKTGESQGLVTVEIVRADGTTATVEVRPSLVMERGRVVGSRGMVLDVTERVEAEQSARQLGVMVSAAADSLVITNVKGTIELVNPAFERMTGYTADEIVGQNPRILKSGEHDASFYSSLWETILAGKVFRATFVNRRKDGELYHQDETITPIRDEAGRVTHFISTGRDVTERVELEKKLRRSQRLEAVGRLAGGVAHDFNNILTAITSFAHFAKESLRPADPARSDIEQIEAAARRAAELTGQLLAFSRRQPVAPRVVNLGTVVEDTARMLGRIVGDDVELVLVPPAGDLWNVSVDPGAFEQVLVNLAVNARDAMPDGGALTIDIENADIDEAFGPRHGETLAPGEYVRFAVSDAGVGMTPEVREQIFEPFFTTKEQGKGTGLGLSTCYGIIKQAGGHISVYSELGRGTTFKIYLPRAKETAHTPATIPTVTDPKGTETVLLAEDDEPVRLLCARTLRKYGYRVLVASNGGEALLIAEGHTEPIALLLTDVVMPKMSGRQLADRLAILHPEMKVLYMSGYTANAIVHQGVLEPGTKFLQKPYSPEALARRVRQVLDEGDEP